MNVIPLEGLALLLGVDRFMSEARAIVNLIGNGIATVVVAKSENEFDNEKYMKVVEEMKREKWPGKKSAKLTFYFCRKEVCYDIHYLLTIIYKCFIVKGHKDY